MLEFFNTVTVGDIISAMLVCALAYEGLMAYAPESLVGPGGWLIDTGEEV
ncbi:hypothetical protein IV417_07745 [Alphaproteobacteria bacterium KMM 3653]|uniref:Uncharacterized protein n=1 Tax=Harenicola maris TaxID=2841044 RepID=A0AAP2CTE4_9RHOB|nr:hypothetical protein [Harenicola maris]